MTQLEQLAIDLINVASPSRSEAALAEVIASRLRETSGS